ncbi:hypothetical protein DEJ25_12715 [Curtobacterium sp. MCPF17_011]|nr:hypothetical protein DEJ25_12715 [Curtobacterium sp. MCPF17_011]
MPTPEDHVRRVAARFDDGSGEVVASALRALARRQARAGKTCAACAERKPLSAFSADSQKADALASRCRSCRRRRW